MSKSLAKMQSSLNHERRVEKPSGFRQCWALKRIYIGQKTIGGTFVSCSKFHREGNLTCWHHRNWEEKAQDLKRYLKDE